MAKAHVSIPLDIEDMAMLKVEFIPMEPESVLDILGSNRVYNTYSERNL